MPAISLLTARAGRRGKTHDCCWHLGCILPRARLSQPQREVREWLCEQEGVITGDGKEKIFDEAMFEVRILQIVNTSDDTWMNISGG